MVKADAACITWPSVMLPSRNFGAHSSSGTTGAIRLEPCDTSVVRMCWPASRAHCRSTLRERLVDAVALFLLAAEQRDAFAVLAHAGQRVAIFGLGLVLVFGNLHEAAADHHDRAGGDRGIEDRGDDEEAGNGDRRCRRP